VIDSAPGRLVIGSKLSRREKALDAVVKVELQKLLLRARLKGLSWAVLKQELLAGESLDEFVAAVRVRCSALPPRRRSRTRSANSEGHRTGEIAWLKPERRAPDHPISRMPLPPHKSVKRGKDADLNRAARAMIENHGANAASEADRRAKNLAACGEESHARMWRQISLLICEIEAGC
jgi:hypothetical protein